MSLFFVFDDFVCLLLLYEGEWKCFRKEITSKVFLTISNNKKLLSKVIIIIKKVIIIIFKEMSYF